MSIMVLDTDHITLLQNNHPLVVARFNQANSDNIWVTIVSTDQEYHQRIIYRMKRMGLVGI